MSVDAKDTVQSLSTATLLEHASDYQERGMKDEAWMICATLLAQWGRNERKMKSAEFRTAISILLDKDINTCADP